MKNLLHLRKNFAPQFRLRQLLKQKSVRPHFLNLLDRVCIAGSCCFGRQLGGRDPLLDREGLRCCNSDNFSNTKKLTDVNTN